MRALESAISALVAIVLLAITYIYAAGHYGMSDARYRCEGQLLPLGSGTAQTVSLRVRLYRSWMHWLRRGGVVFFEHPSFIEYPATYPHVHEGREFQVTDSVWDGSRGSSRGATVLE
jgi:hypothetical protein